MHIYLVPSPASLIQVEVKFVCATPISPTTILFGSHSRISLPHFKLNRPFQVIIYLTHPPHGTTQKAHMESTFTTFNSPDQRSQSRTAGQEERKLSLRLNFLFLFQLIYACITLKRWCEPIRSHGALGFVGVLLVTLSVAAGFGFSALCGITFNAASTQVRIITFRYSSTK